MARPDGSRMWRWEMDRIGGKAPGPYYDLSHVDVAITTSWFLILKAMLEFLLSLLALLLFTIATVLILLPSHRTSHPSALSFSLLRHICLLFHTENGCHLNGPALTFLTYLQLYSSFSLSHRFSQQGYPIELSTMVYMFLSSLPTTAGATCGY